MSDTITHDQAEEIVAGYDGWIATQDVSKHRWYTKQLVVFSDDEHLSGFYYLDPASEEQEDQDRFEASPVPIFPVESYDVVTTVYRPAGELF